MEQNVELGKRNLIIRHLGPIRSANIDLKNVNVVIGEQSSGKSCLLKTACYCTWVEKRIEIEQGTERFNHGDAFIQQLIQFHKMDDFVSEDTEIAYESDYMCFSYTHKHRKFSFEWKSGRWKYQRSKVSYIPSERNLVAAIPNWFQVKFDGNNIQDFMADWEDARKSMTAGYEVLNLGVSYYYDPTNKSDNVRMGNDKTMKFTNSSSGLQSLIPLLVLLSYITSEKYRTKDAGSFGKNKERGQVLNALTKYYIEHQDELRLLIGAGKEERMIWDDGFGNTQYHQEAFDLLERISEQFITTHHCDIFLEEPEQNLFPPTQGVLIQFLMTLAEGRHHNRIFIATHSPYILGDMLERTNYDFGLFYIQPNGDDGMSEVRQATAQDIQEIYEDGVDAFFNIETLGHE
ncbi:MAG: ATP-binding protein [Prevotella sp.]|nr:ATP-binding protein [Prevotella sp.]